MKRPSSWILDLPPRHRQGDVHGPADCLQVRHPVAASVFCPGKLPRLPDHAAYRVGVIRRAYPVQRDVRDRGLAERVLASRFVVNVFNKTAELVFGQIH